MPRDDFLDIASFACVRSGKKARNLRKLVLIKAGKISP